MIILIKDWDVGRVYGERRPWLQNFEFVLKFGWDSGGVSTGLETHPCSYQLIILHLSFKKLAPSRARLSLCYLMSLETIAASQYLGSLSHLKPPQIKKDFDRRRLRAQRPRFPFRLSKGGVCSGGVCVWWWGGVISTGFDCLKMASGAGWKMSGMLVWRKGNKKEEEGEKRRRPTQSAAV